MLVITSEIRVQGLTGRQVTDFMLSCNDEQYQGWWPGTHLQLHSVGRSVGTVADTVLMDEFIGQRRLRLQGTVEEMDPGRRIVWRLRKIIPLPARLSLVLSPVPDGVMVKHTVTVGWRRIGRILDPLLRLYLTPRFGPTSRHTCTPNSPCCGTTSVRTLQPAHRMARQRQATRTPGNPCRDSRRTTATGALRPRCARAWEERLPDVSGRWRKGCRS